MVGEETNSDLAIQALLQILELISLNSILDSLITHGQNESSSTEKLQITNLEQPRRLLDCITRCNRNTRPVRN